ncbi:MAG: PAS-domain containing protein [Sneathiella sp.]|nr:PAS-domain containing protein [Sneathiella sp.]
MERQLELEDIFLDALENIPEAYVIYDKNGKLVRCNDKFRALYNYTKKEASFGVHFSTLNGLDLERGTIKFQDGETATTRFLPVKNGRFQKKSSPTIFQLSDDRWIKITDSALNSGGVISIQSDVTELKKNEILLKEAKQQAEISDRAKSEFMANMSHELRTPLNAIIGFSSLLGSEIYGPHSNPRYKEYAHDIEGAGEHLLSLINEILDLAKIETGSMSLNERKVNIRQLCKSCKTMVDTRASERNIKIDINISPPSLSLYADPIRLKQILVNLVSNAVKFSQKDSRVSITWKIEKEKVSLIVQDSGIGIEQEFLPHLYEPFQRSKLSKDIKSEGTGLGLTLVKRFSDAHDAKLIVTSKPGKGTIFKVEFPKFRSIGSQSVLAF